MKSFIKKNKKIIIITSIVIAFIMSIIFIPTRITAIEYNKEISICNNYIQDDYKYDNFTKKKTYNKVKKECSKIIEDTESKISSLEEKANELNIDTNDLITKDKIKTIDNLEEAIKNKETEIKEREAKEKQEEKEVKANNTNTVDNNNNFNNSNNTNISNNTSNNNSSSNNSNSQTCNGQIIGGMCVHPPEAQVCPPGSPGQWTYQQAGEWGDKRYPNINVSVADWGDSFEIANADTGESLAAIDECGNIWYY